MDNIKIVYDSQSYFHYYNLKKKLHRCIQNIYFNRKCLQHNIIPKYAKIKVPNTSPIAKRSQKTASIQRIKDEIRFLYCKKQNLNKQLYKSHLHLANTWNSMWPCIQNIIDSKIANIATKNYTKLDLKIEQLKKTYQNTTHTNIKFAPRVINNTNIIFTEDELSLLNKGLKYNLHSKKKDWIKTLALEAETAVNKLPEIDREYYRWQVANKIDILYNTKQNNTYKNQNGKFEINTVKHIKTKLKQNSAMISKADKGNSIIILYINDYNQKLQEFIITNKFRKLPTDPTDRFQIRIRETVKKCKTLIQQQQKWKYINLNPTAPTLRGTIKIHKENHPIRPIVNWKNAPAYNIAKGFNSILNELSLLPHIYNIKNTIQLTQELQQIKIDCNTKLASLDISNMYTNIPINETRNILQGMLTNNLTQHNEMQEILNWYDVITQQNYFKVNDAIYTQQDGLAMGAPSSGTISEIFLQYIECNSILPILIKHCILGYYRYVDDILILYDSSNTHIQSILKDFNIIHPNLNFTLETETNNQLNYLDITIHRTNTNLKFNIYRKPTFTDTIIPYDSCHPPEHKNAAIRYLYNRINTYNLNNEAIDEESKTIKKIMENNKYPSQSYTYRPNNNSNKIPTQMQSKEQKWVNFTYIGKETNIITRIFKNTNVKISYRTNNNTQNLLHQRQTQTDKYLASGIYKLTCPDCGKAYVGQTGRSFYTRYKEHNLSYRTNKSNSNYAKHMIDNNHTFPPIEEALYILEFHKKSMHMNTLERYHIHKEAHQNNHLNDQHTVPHNKIFQIIQKNENPKTL